MRVIKRVVLIQEIHIHGNKAVQTKLIILKVDLVDISEMKMIKTVLMI